MNRIKRIRKSSHEQYTEVLNMPYVIPALKRVQELRPLQSDRSLFNTDNRIEFTSLVTSLHNLSMNDGIKLHQQALYIWLHMREGALNALTFGDVGYREQPEPEAFQTIRKLLETYREERARRKDALLQKMVMSAINTGNVDNLGERQERDENFTSYLESLKPPDVKQIVQEVLRK